MTWESLYIPPDPKTWQGRADFPEDACFYQHMRLLDCLAQSPERTADTTFALIGFKSDEGVQRDLGRAGAAEGPIAIRQRLAKLPIQKPEIHIYDAGNIICHQHDMEASQAALGELIAKLLKANIRPIVMGGSHELAYAQYLGISKTTAQSSHLGIINFDAHFDMHPLPKNGIGSASTTFFQIALAHQQEKRRLDYNCLGIQHVGDIRQSFDLAKQYQVKSIFADDLHQGLNEKCFDFIDRIVDENDHLYFSLSLDVFSPAFAPGVASIQPLGLSPWHIIPLLRQTAASGKVLTYDISEHVPRYDIDHRTAKLAAILIYEIIHHHRDRQHAWSSAT
jgi:formiminoglutamase